MTRDVLVKAFRTEARKNKNIFNASADKIAGYYLHNYPKDTLSFLSRDVKDLKLSVMRGEQVKMFIKACSSQV